jgi:NAD(P)-dependent dehydrogenase (short-subunit alcohol dehydrogenase family)
MNAEPATVGERNGRVTWVVGASSGIGRAVAEAAAGAGRRVAVSARRADRLDEVIAGIPAERGAASAFPGDAMEPSWASVTAATVTERFGRIDELVLAAGLNTPQRRWADQTMAGFEAVVATNLVATARILDAALPALRVRGGTVVIVSSYAAWAFQPGAGVAYSASKSGLGPLCRTLNAEEGEHGIRATHLCPGDVDTEFLRQRPVVPDDAARARMLTPADVARSVLHALDAPPHVRIDELVLSPLSQR